MNKQAQLIVDSDGLTHVILVDKPERDKTKAKIESNIVIIQGRCRFDEDDLKRALDIGLRETMRLLKRFDSKARVVVIRRD